MKNNQVTVIMYHYVRDLIHTQYKNIKGLDYRLFHEQIQYLRKHYEFVTIEMIIDSVENNTPLPYNAALLTFDDGYTDHFKYAFPYLDKYKIQGCFYAPVKAITENKILDVNKIHYILSKEDNNHKILEEIKALLHQYKDEYQLKDFDYYQDKLAHATRFDTAETIFIKRLLQVELDETLRNTISNILFEKIIGIDEASFSRELYMDIDQLQCMSRNGMHIGSHGYNHYWFASLDKETQRNEIEKSLAFLEQVNGNNDNWTMCYPYGSHNQDTIDLLEEYKCKLAFTTEVDIYNTTQNHRFKIPRLDTNDIPKDANAAVNSWYDKLQK